MFIDENGKKQKTRKRTGNKWFETQDQIAYWKEFEKEKIVWNPVSGEYFFVFINEEIYFNNSLFMITGKYLKFIITLLNSSIYKWLIVKTTNLVTTGQYAYGSKEKIEKLPIPKIKNTQPFEILADIIQNLVAKSDVRAKFFEDVVDIMVYELYFEKELKEKDFDIISIVTKDLQKTTDPNKLFEKWSDRKHKVKKAIDFIDTVEAVKIIKGLN